MGVDFSSGKQGATGATGASGPPAGSYSVVTAGADPSGVADSTTAIGNAIDTVLGNQNLYRTVWFPAGTYKMNNQIQRLAIANGATLNLAGGGNVTIDATGSTDTYIFDLEGSTGNTLAAGSSLGAPIAAGDGQITLAVGGVAALGLVAGDRMMLTTRLYADSRASTGNVSSGSPTISSVTGNLANWNNGDLVQTNTPCFPAGTTILSGAGTATMTASANAFASGTGVPVYKPDTNYLWNVARENYYKGEIVRVPLTNEVTGGPIAGDVVQLGRNTFDSYANTYTTIHKLNMPAIRIEGINFVRNGNKQAFTIQYAQPAEIVNCKGSGARDRLFYLNYCDGVLIDNCYGVDFWNSTTGTCYGIVISSCMDATVTRNRMFGGRHAITHTGFWPSRGVKVIGNSFANVDKTVPCVDYHENAELCLLQDNTIYDGIGCSASNVQIQNNHIRAHGVTGLAMLSSRAGGYWKIEGNTIVTDGSVDAITLKNQIPLNNHVVNTVSIIGNTIRTNVGGIRCAPLSTNYPNWQIDNWIMGQNDVRSTAQALLFQVTGSADVQVNSFKSYEDWLESTGNDATSISVNTNSAVARFRDTTLKQNRVSGRVMDGTTGLAFKDMWFDGCKFTQGAGTTNDSRGLTLYSTGQVTFRDCEFSAENVTGLRNGGITLTAVTERVTFDNCRFPPAATASGVAQVNAACAMTERREGSPLLVAGDWVLAGWGASAVATLGPQSTDTRGQLIITTNAADTPTANPTATLTLKERGFSFQPSAVASYDSSSTGPTATPGIANVSTNCAQTTAGTSTTNAVTKLKLTYQGTPTATSSKTYIFNYRIDG